MDTKNKVPLDPKLKAAYDRVMGFSAPNTSNKPTPPVMPQATQVPHEEIKTAPQDLNKASIPSDTYNVSELHDGDTTAKKSLHPSQVSGEKQPKSEEPAGTKHNSMLKPVLISVFGGLFLLVYAYFWAVILDI